VKGDLKTIFISFQTFVLLRVHNFRGFASCCSAKCSAKLYLRRRFAGARTYAMAVGGRSSRGSLTAVRQNVTPLFLHILSALDRPTSLSQLRLHEEDIGATRHDTTHPGRMTAMSHPAGFALKRPALC
jgi:hypothetical protein